MDTTRRVFFGMACVAIALGCGSERTEPGPGCVDGVRAAPGNDLTKRAYIVSRDSPEVAVLNLDTLELEGSLGGDCGGGHGGHMLELNGDYTKAYVSEGMQTFVYDTRSGKRLNSIATNDATHLSLSRDGLTLAVVDEGINAVHFVDTKVDKVVKTVPGFFTPHFVRFAPNGKHAYVANIGAHHLSRVSLSTFEIDGHIALEGFDGPPNETLAEEEGGFADAQMDENGVLYAAHSKTGRVIVYDTNTQTKLREVPVGKKPWIVYAEHPFHSIEARVVPNFGDLSVSVLNRLDVTTKTIGGADSESFGVNYSPLAPDTAFVMNRFRAEIAVMNTKTGERVDSIPVGGNTETASTTADGRYVVATVSNANRVVVIDAVTHKIMKAFENVGRYPWSVTIPKGQNYCH